MAHLKSPFRFWANEDKGLRFLQKVGNKKCRGEKFEEPSMRMSDLNNSYNASIKHNLKTTDLDEDFDDNMSIKTNIYSSISKIEYQNDNKFSNEIMEQEINVELNEGPNEENFRKFMRNVSQTQINFINETQEIVVTTNDIITERIPYQDLINNNDNKEAKDIVILENSPNNNSREVKIIKVKITVPKGALNNSLMNKNNVLSIVNDLSTLNVVKNVSDNFFETPENTPERQCKEDKECIMPMYSRISKYESSTKTINTISNIYSSPSKIVQPNEKIECATEELYSSPIKISQLSKSPKKVYKYKKACRTPPKVYNSPFKSPRKSSPSKPLYSNERYSMTEFDNLVNKTHNYKPIMGKNALLAKAYAIKNNTNETSRDSEIVQELVTDRFNDVLVNHYQRSFKRQTSRKDRLSDDENVVEDCRKEDSIFDANLIKHSSTLNESTTSEPLYESIINYQFNNSINEDLKSQHSNKSHPIYESITNLHATPKVVVIDHTKSCSSIEKQNLVLKSRQSISSVDEHYSLHSFEVCSIGSLRDEINLNFILSTDDANIETSFEVNNFSSKTEINEEGYETSSSLQEIEEKVEYDAHKFLKDALGDEYISTDSHLEESNDRMDSSKNQSIGTSNISALISKASSLYSTISSKMQRTHSKIPTAPIYEEAPRLQNEYAECFPTTKKMSELIQESVVQNQIMNQTSKALSLCKSIKEFAASVEQIEAERILLIATNRREVILEEIRKTEYEEIDGYNPMNFGTVRISNLKFPAKQMSPYSDTTPKRNRDFTQWFLCTVNSGPQLLATKSVLPDEYGMVCFDDEFAFDSLSADFEINVCLYSMKVRNNLRNYSHESKYKLNKNGKTLCPTPPHKLFSLNKPSSHRGKSPDDYFRPSSFKLWGKLPLRINHLKNTDQFKLISVPLSSTLDGTAIMDLESEVQLRETYSGFLNIGSESGEGVLWSRRWCSLNGAHLNFYNYPCEDASIAPIGFIDLSCCVTSWVSVADREICARPKTLLLETLNPPNTKRRGSSHSRASNNIVRNFLTADTIDEMKMWETKLNSIVSALRNWKCMKVNLQFVK